jgi:hypothetical protein
MLLSIVIVAVVLRRGGAMTIGIANVVAIAFGVASVVVIVVPLLMTTAGVSMSRLG